MIKEIHLKNFRLFKEYNLQTKNSLVILSGRNATGKTSILEAIYLCATSKSHRTTSLDSIIKNNEEYAVCEIHSDKVYRMVISKLGKKVFINQKEITKMSEFIGKLNVVLFSPYDLNLIQGSKGDKRRFLDLEISLMDKKYLMASSAYKRLLRERNETLKNKMIDPTYLSVITNEMIPYIESIYKKRMEFISRLNEELKKISKELDIETVELIYNSTYDIQHLSRSFEEKQRTDFMTKVTNIGPHRDDFSILMNGLNAENYASEGQARTICLAIKLALKEYICQIRNQEPILLLDDVFAALDKKRISYITKYVIQSQQTFITTTSVLEIPDELIKNALVLRIENKKEI